MLDHESGRCCCGVEVEGAAEAEAAADTAEARKE